jgi:trk system potassium uptake protein TrkA
MGKPGEFAVIGLGQFGRAVVLSLIHEGQAVLAVDSDPNRVQSLADEADSVVVADATDEEALTGLQLESMSCVVVTIGSKATEASILTTALLRQLGVPRIVARAFNDLHARVLVAVGAHEVINPEAEMGRRLALRLAHPGIVDQIQLGDAQLAEIEAPQTFVGRTLEELDLRRRYKVSVVALRRDQAVNSNPGAEARVQDGDVVVILGAPDDIRRIAALE